MSITPRFTTAAKHTLKTSRLVARGRGVPRADHLDILLAALAVGTELHPTMPIPTPRTLWDSLRHPIGFTPHARSLVRTVATQATTDITPRELGLTVLRLKEPEVVEKLGDMGLSVDQCTAAFN
ncbi:hypothetical protein [Corynebacterium matruchotii]|uniref:hypothetical protein n=1 Tax=Corynebacterium matruchotii TaxID=43768 RepID=UPI0028EA1920|nr:hypothetical protein [Corynebacterium matruchotii]